MDLCLMLHQIHRTIVLAMFILLMFNVGSNSKCRGTIISSSSIICLLTLLTNVIFVTCDHFKFDSIKFYMFYYLKGKWYDQEMPHS